MRPQQSRHRTFSVDGRVVWIEQTATAEARTVCVCVRVRACENIHSQVPLFALAEARISVTSLPMWAAKILMGI